LSDADVRRKTAWVFIRWFSALYRFLSPDSEMQVNGKDQDRINIISIFAQNEFF
jgi:hypothetical protein